MSKNSQKQSTIFRKRKLVEKAAIYMGGQVKLIEAMNFKDRPDGRTTHQTDVSRWINEDRMVSVLDAMWIHKATGGFVRFEEFYPYLKEQVMSIARLTCRDKAA